MQLLLDILALNIAHQVCDVYICTGACLNNSRCDLGQVHTCTILPHLIWVGLLSYINTSQLISFAACTSPYTHKHTRHTPTHTHVYLHVYIFKSHMYMYVWSGQYSIATLQLLYTVQLRGTLFLLPTLTVDVQKHTTQEYIFYWQHYYALYFNYYEGHHEPY